MFPLLHGVVSQSVIAANWWEAGGATGAVAVYQPIGAASLAASYTNLANPGTYDAAPGVAPVWSQTGAWTFSGTQYLLTGVTPGVTWSMIIKFSDSTNVIGTLAGSYNDNANDSAFLVTIKHPMAAGGVLFGNGTNTSAVGQVPNLLAGVVGVAGKSTYRNGVFDQTIPAGAGTSYTPIPIGTLHYNGSSYTQNYTGRIQAIAIYDNILSAAQVAAVTAAMNELATSPAVAVVIGDSITAGLNATTQGQRWANIVANIYDYDLVNSGIASTMLQNTAQNTVATIGAAAANNGRDTYTTRITAYTPDYVYILYGLNDLRLNDAAITAANFENDLSEIVDGLILSGVDADKIVIGSPPYVPVASYALYSPYNAGSTLKHTQYVAACAAVAGAKSTKYIDVYQWMIDNGGDTLISADGIHPNDAGHAQIAAAFLSVL